MPSTDRRKLAPMRYRVSQLSRRVRGKKSILEADHPAIIAARLEEIFRTLTANTVGAKTVRVDHGAFHRAIAYFRRIAEGKIVPDESHGMPDEEAEIVRLLGMHNQSMTWVWSGDPGLMILQCALNTSSIAPALRVV